jgi:DNA repair protein RecN (Recombination protein N)
MLLELRIKNLVVVEDVTLTFEKNLNVLTGSTGTGKSLILGAVNLLLGERASNRLIRSGADTAEVEGIFRIAASEKNLLFPSDGTSDLISLRREIQQSGRSAAFIQDRPVPVKALRDACIALIEPHGQNEQLRLKNPENHIGYLDKLAGNQSLRQSYARQLETMRAASARLREFDRKIVLLKEKRELFEHRLSEIDRAGIEPGERDVLQARLKVAENAQKIYEALHQSAEALYDGEISAESLVSQAAALIARIETLDPKFEAFTEQLETARITAKECAGEMRSYLSGLEFDSAELERMQERYAFLLGLERRYGKPVDDVLADCDKWRQELESLTFEDEERNKLEAEFQQAVKTLSATIKKLTAGRIRTAKELDQKITAEMQNLMMSGASFRTEIELEPDPSSPLKIAGRPVRLFEHGVDQVEFFVRTNKGEDEGGLCTIASTGEISRIALALKKVTQAGADTGTLVFDEIDAGVGADLGDVIARELRALAASYQIICITHMPQIAAAGEHHITVSKQNLGGRTTVQAAPVEGEERLKELARMLGGSKGSEKRLALAAEMLDKRSNKTRSKVRP